MCLLNKKCHVGVHTAKEIEAPYPDLPSEWTDALSKATQDLIAYHILHPSILLHTPSADRNVKRLVPFQL